VAVLRGSSKHARLAEQLEATFASGVQLEVAAI